MANAVNISFEDYLDEFTHHEGVPTLHVIFLVFDVIFFCVSFLGNAFILYVLLKEEAWKTASDILVLQLTVSNLCFALTLPFSICNIMEVWIFGVWGCKFASGMYFLGLNSCVLLLCGMALDRYAAAVHTAHEASTRAARKQWVVVGSSVAWLLCVAVSIKEAAIITSEENDDGTGFCVHSHSFAVLIFSILLEVIVFFFIPFLVIAYCYVHMLVNQWRLSRYLQTSRLTLAITGGILFCLTPYNIVLFFDCLAMLGLIEFRGHAMLFTVYMLLSSHCCVHPLVSALGARRFRRHLPLPLAQFRRNESVQNLTSLVILEPHDSDVTQPGL